MSWTVHTIDRNGLVRAWVLAGVDARTGEPYGCIALTDTSRFRAVQRLAVLLHGMADAADTAALEALEALGAQFDMATQGAPA